MEINEDQPNEKSKGYLFRACFSKEGRHYHLGGGGVGVCMCVFNGEKRKPLGIP